jgi:hypothetical protein
VVKGRVRDGWVGLRNDAKVDVILETVSSQLCDVDRAAYPSDLLLSYILVKNKRLDPGFFKDLSGANSLHRLIKKI